MERYAGSLLILDYIEQKFLNNDRLAVTLEFFLTDLLYMASRPRVGDCLVICSLSL